MKPLLFVFALLPPLPLAGQRPSHWSAPDVVLASSFVTAAWIDVAQTHYLLAHGGTEENLLLGRHPSAAQVDVMASLGVLGVLGTAAVLPPKWRKVVLAVGLVTESYMVYSNARLQLGAGIRF